MWDRNLRLSILGTYSLAESVIHVNMASAQTRGQANGTPYPDHDDRLLPGHRSADRYRLLRLMEKLAYGLTVIAGVLVAYRRITYRLWVAWCRERR
jgi:hypothetical protein